MLICIEIIRVYNVVVGESLSNNMYLFFSELCLDESVLIWLEHWKDAIGLPKPTKEGSMQRRVVLKSYIIIRLVSLNAVLKII